MESYQALESKLSVWSGCPNIVACSSGTAALHLALESLNLPRGGHILIPEFTMIACARAASMAGLRPVFVDCDDSLRMDPNQIEQYITKQTAAIMPVHIYGRVCDMSAISDIARKYNLFVIEDLAEAHGIRPHYSTHAAMWSFYQNKIVCGEEGGAVAFAFKTEADKARTLRCQGFTEDHDFMHVPRGNNYRLSNANASLISKSLSSFNENLAKRREVEGWYDSLVPEILHMPPRQSPWVYDLYFRNGIPNGLVESLNMRGIQARYSFKPMSQQPEYLGHYRHLNAYRMAQRVIYLPIKPDMTQVRVKSIVNELLDCAQ